MTIQIGDKVKVLNRHCSDFGREGFVSSIGKRVLPIGVKLEDELYETDFTEDELEVVRP